MRKILPTLLLLLFGWSAKAANIYFGNAAAGGNTGADCADQRALSTHVIGDDVAGNTLHLCGTITGTAGTTLLNLLASGSAGNLITVKFETNAILQAPYFAGNGSQVGGAIKDNGFNYITIDGGTNGIIQNTANGTSLANQQNSVGVYVSGDHITVKNLTVQNIYVNQGNVNTASDSAGLNTIGIRVESGSSNITVQNNTIKAVSDGIGFDTVGSATVCNNTISDMHWGIGANGQGSPLICQNDISNWTNWQWPTSAYHTDGIIVFGSGTSNVITPIIDKNYIHGDLGQGSPTGFVFCTFAGGSTNEGSACTLTNNLFVGTGSMVNNDSMFWMHTPFGDSVAHVMGPHVVYNNTFVNSGFQVGGDGDSSTVLTEKNNVYVGGSGLATFFLSSQSADFAFANLTADYNVYYNGRTGGYLNWGSTGAGNGGSNNYNNFTTWQAQPCAPGTCDAHSVQGSNPNLNGTTFMLTSPSSAIGEAVNLTSLCTGSLVVLCTDKNGNARPTGATAWDAGAYNYSSGAPATPTNISVIVVGP